jgi:hypothetical protein
MDETEGRRASNVRITFEGHDVVITGVSPELADSPDRIRELMSLLDLPKGTRADIAVTFSTAMIR